MSVVPLIRVACADSARRVGATAVAAFVACLGVFGAGAALAQRTLPEQALAQIKATQDLKRSMSAAERKMGTPLVVELRRRRGDAALNSLSALRSGARVSPAGTVLVDIDAAVSDDLLSTIKSYRGARVVNSFEQYDAIRAEVPLTALENLAARGDVRRIRPAARAMTRKIDTTEGDRTHRADDSRAVYGADGAGVKVCALSDDVSQLAALQASGDLPAVDVLPGQAGDPETSEGTALLEIIHDLVPGASLGFATAFDGQASFATNITNLGASGCDVIVDDVFYIAEPVFQDGIIAQAVDAMAAAGKVYVSAAGNSGNLNDGTAGVWEGDWVDGGAPPDPLTVGVEGSAHDWGGGDITNLVRTDGVGVDAEVGFGYVLQWSDPWGKSANDYDLYIFDNSLTNMVESSDDFQIYPDPLCVDGCTYDPVEYVPQVFAGEQVVVTRFDGDPRYLHLNTLGGRLEHATDGNIAGHAAAQGAIAVAAVDQAEAGTGSFKFPETGPVAAETFTSDGPRKIFYNPAGQAITPGNVSASGGLERLKPDLTAADGVMTATPGFKPFFGTSASAPHVAGVAALVKSVDPALTGPQIRQILEGTATDVKTPGWDRDTGHGIVDALDAANSLGVSALITCAGKPPTILGDNSANTLAGTLGSDVIMGFGGSDTISAGKGDDYVCGGGGKDSIDGGLGNDMLLGGGGDDEIDGGGGDDTIKAGGGDDTVKAGGGDDKVGGGKGNDLLLGQGGKDTIKGNGGRDDIDGGKGNDVAVGGGGNDTVEGGKGKKDVLKGKGGRDSLTDKKAKKFHGGTGKDVCVGKGRKIKCEA